MRRNLGDLQKKIFDFIHNPRTTSRFRVSSVDFSRTSCLSFPVVVSSILRLFKESVDFNIQSVLDCFTGRSVTGSAFTQARYKVKSDFFKELCQIPLQTYLSSKKKIWKGHILLAGDGSTLMLPSSKAIQDFFGIHYSTRFGVKRSLSRVFFVYDVLNDFVVASELSKMEKGEKPQLLGCLDSLAHMDSIMILDRGFGNYCTIKELIDRQQGFCVRLGIKNSNFAKLILNENETDFMTTWTPSPKEKENSKKLGLNPVPITVRVTKVKLKTGETELLVTSLNNLKKYKSKDVAKLYGLRWGVEEAFKNLKPKMKIELFGCKKPEGIIQEFYAHVFCINMIALYGMTAGKIVERKTKNRQWGYKYNWKNAYRFFREKVMSLLLRINQRTVNKLIDRMANSTVAIRPSRVFPRDTKHGTLQARQNQSYK